MKIICLTGGIGSGKTTVASILEKHGATVISADKIARDVVTKGEIAYNKIAEYFGTSIIDQDGGIDRQKLAGIVFNDKAKLDMLNSFTHPEILNEVKDEVEKLKNQGFNGIVVIDAAIPYKLILELSEQVWVVDCDDRSKIQRITERMGITEKEAQERISSQLTREEYVRIADKIIKNNSTVEELEEKVVILMSD